MDVINPVVVPATQEMKYDQFHISMLRFMAKDPASPVQVVATLEKLALINGEYKFAPPGTEGVKVNLTIPDLNKLAANDKEIAAMIPALMMKVKTVAEGMKAI